jgi:hypothetical protein
VAGDQGRRPRRRAAEAAAEVSASERVRRTVVLVHGVEQTKSKKSKDKDGERGKAAPCVAGGGRRAVGGGRASHCQERREPSAGPAIRCGGQWKKRRCQAFCRWAAGGGVGARGRGQTHDAAEAAPAPEEPEPVNRERSGSPSERRREERREKREARSLLKPEA